MESKKGNLQALSKQQSSKMQVVKTASEVSLIPSQAAEQAKERKNPLDALSRLSLRPQGVEKRSGLQDVDEEYLKKNMFSRTHINRHAGLNDSSEHQGHTNSMAQGDASHIQLQQYQGKQPYNPNSTNAHSTSLSAQQIQQTTEILSQQHVPIHQLQTPSSTMQCKNQSVKEPHLSQPRTEASRNQQSQQSVLSSPVPAPEPELCTTCPNCQTTIYLVHGHDTNSESAQGYTSIQHDTTGSTTAN